MDIIPYEILEEVTDFISYKDVLNLRLTCRVFHDSISMKQIQKDKSRCFLMLVRNETVDILIPFLDSILPYISYWVICDANSTDNGVTRDLILNYFQFVGIRGEFHKMGQFRGAETITNIMRLAKNKAKYILFPDDYYPIINNKIDKRLTLDGYNIFYHYENIKLAKIILYKGSLDWVFSGRGLFYYPITGGREIGIR